MALFNFTVIDLSNPAEPKEIPFIDETPFIAEPEEVAEPQEIPFTDTVSFLSVSVCFTTLPCIPLLGSLPWGRCLLCPLAQQEVKTSPTPIQAKQAPGAKSMSKTKKGNRSKSTLVSSPCVCTLHLAPLCFPPT